MHHLLQAPERLPLFADPCANKHGGNHNSIAGHTKQNKEARYQEILGLLEGAKDAGLTGKEIARLLGVELNTVSGRFSELKIMKRVVALRREFNREGAAVLVLPRFAKGAQP